jgi:hypothetical protein
MIFSTSDNRTRPGTTRGLHRNFIEPIIKLILELFTESLGMFLQKSFLEGEHQRFLGELLSPLFLLFYQSIDRSIKYPPLIEHSSSFNSETKW